MSETGKEVAVRKAELVAGERVAPIIPRTIEEVGRIAHAVIVAGLAPDSYKTTNKEETASRIMVGIMKGAEVGLSPLTALANIAIINGRPSLYGDGAVALVQASGLVTKWEERFEGEEGKDNHTAVCRIWRKEQSEPYEGRFAFGDAKRAKLTTKLPWIQYPSRMLMWRARTYAMRTGFADCLSGLGIAEEVIDIPQPPKPVDASFLDDKPPATFPKDEQPPSEILARGLDALTRTAPKDVEDLRLTIVNELVAAKMPEREFATWHNSCDARASEK